MTADETRTLASANVAAPEAGALRALAEVRACHCDLDIGISLVIEHLSLVTSLRLVVPPFP